ncbi:MAG: glutaminyl-peptide cyclotransferase [Actinophytocola sp.]|nr:glutaminyl-peptide cyclotransferase [Actinophytocola sp.]
MSRTAGAALVSLLLACGTESPEPIGGDPTGGDSKGDDPGIVVTPQPPERLRTQVLETLPHDTNAFTQGFEISHGILYESTGLVGKSWVRALDITSGREVARVALPEPLFGEGITIADSSVWQVTWQNGVAIERDAATLKERRRVSYSGEGWGLCHQSGKDRLIMSDGSGTLTFRDPDTFERTGEVRVRSGGRPVTRLNELECVDELVYANVWQSDTILRIDSETGKVTGDIDASGLLEKSEQADADVLNGIAAIPGSDAFFVTGKLWPKTFRVRFVPR